MPRPIPANQLGQIEEAVRARPGITSAQIADVLGEQVPRRTLQFRLKRLVAQAAKLTALGEVHLALNRTPQAVRTVQDALAITREDATLVSADAA